MRNNPWLLFRQTQRPNMASASQDGGPDPPKSTKKRRSVSKAAKKSNSSALVLALVLALDYAAGQSEVFGLEPGEDPRFSTRQKVTAADLSQANITRRVDLQATIFVESDQQ